ncbi:MAG: hypothetical protein JNK82_05040 [Myxococcaceae bacterium]|nr:hypothetical protein [Myxococcaceae bacterium]
MVTRLLWLSVVSFGCAVSSCATTADAASKLPAAEVFRSPGLQSAPTPEQFVLSQSDPRTCVHMARGEAPELAWSYLKACVKHRGLSDLNLLLTDWPRELRTERDANEVLARVLSERKSLKTDVQLLQRHGIGVYDLTTALMRPSAYRGRLIAFMGEVRESKAVRTVNLVEVQYGSEPIEVRSAPRVTFETTTADGHHEKTTRDETELRFIPAANETGRELIARLPGASLSLSADRPHLFLARFEGTQQLDARIDDPAAVVQVVAYSGL